MPDVETARGKAPRLGVELGDISLVPSRRTRDTDEIDISWQLEAYRFELPVMAGVSDSAVSPTTAGEIARLGALPVLDLEGLWTRYEDAEIDPILAKLDSAEPGALIPLLQEVYAVPVKLELVSRRVGDLNQAGVVACGSVSPQKASALAPAAVAAGLDALVIKGEVVSAEHVTNAGDALSMKDFIRKLEVPVMVGGCASYHVALHLMRTGAVGVIVGVGSGSGRRTSEVLGVSVPQATALSEAAAARSRHLEETGVYVHLISDGGLSTGGEMAKALACGADAVMLGAPLARAREAALPGLYWEAAAAHPRLPLADPTRSSPLGRLEEILVGPSQVADGTVNLCGALRASMAACGYATIRQFHKADVVVTAR